MLAALGTQVFHPLLELMAHADVEIRHFANTIFVSGLRCVYRDMPLCTLVRCC